MASAYDTFDAASTQALTAYSSNWADAWNASYIGVDGTAKDFTGTATTDHAAARWTADTFGADQFSQVRITALGLGADRYTGVGVRLTAGGGYAFIVKDSLWYVYRWDGSFVFLDSGSRTQSVGEVLRLEVSGTGATVTLVAKINGTTISTVNDTSGSRKLSGAPGVASFSTGEAHGDDWVGGDSDSYDTLDEVVSSRTDYIKTGSAGAVFVFDGQPIPQPEAGTSIFIDYDAGNAGGSAVKVEILDPRVS